LGVPLGLVRVQYVSGEPDVGRIESTENGTHFCFVASRFRTPCQFLLALRVYPSPDIPVIHKITKMTDLEARVNIFDLVGFEILFDENPTLTQAS
jgi:hypothetical protein